MMLLVSGSTRTVARLAHDWPHHLGHLLTPANRNGMGALTSTGLSWACDNGAFKGFDEAAFRRMLRKIQGHPRLLWVVAPDVVANARATLALYPWWALEIRSLGLPVAFVLQDGQEDLPLPEADAYFIGGSTRWKLSQAAHDLTTEGKRRGAWIHMGRVNSLRRLRYAFDMGCDSADGSSISMYGDKYIHAFCRWLRFLEQQPTLF